MHAVSWVHSRWTCLRGCSHSGRWICLTLHLPSKKYWHRQLSFIFKCLCDIIILDDFKTALDRIRDHWLQSTNPDNFLVMPQTESIEAQVALRQRKRNAVSPFWWLLHILKVYQLVQIGMGDTKRSKIYDRSWIISDPDPSIEVELRQHTYHDMIPKSSYIYNGNIDRDFYILVVGIL